MLFQIAEDWCVPISPLNKETSTATLLTLSHLSYAKALFDYICNQFKVYSGV